MKQRFGGVFTALVTPFNSNDELDKNAFSELLARQKVSGINGIVVAGSTGESACLSLEEKKTLVKMAKAETSLPIVAGAGSNCTKDAVLAHQIMADVGADTTLQVVPYYNKPTQKGLFEHFSAIAKSSSLPMILYNVPGRTGIDIHPETVLELALAHENIIGIKDANTDMERLSIMFHKLSARPDFLVLCGEDGAFLPFLSQGGDGIISVVSHIAAKEMLAIYSTFQNGGDLIYAQKIAMKLSGLCKLMFTHPNPIPIKTVLALMGIIEKNFRLPLCPMSKADEEILVEALSEFKFLQSFKSAGFLQ